LLRFSIKVYFDVFTLAFLKPMMQEEPSDL